jgi:hypothetical protein
MPETKYRWVPPKNFQKRLFYILNHKRFLLDAFLNSVQQLQ